MPAHNLIRPRVWNLAPRTAPARCRGGQAFLLASAGVAAQWKLGNLARAAAAGRGGAGARGTGSRRARARARARTPSPAPERASRIAGCSAARWPFRSRTTAAGESRAQGPREGLCREVGRRWREGHPISSLVPATLHLWMQGAGRAGEVESR